MEATAEENALLDDPFQNMKVTELRKELKARGLPATGTKVELLERLQNAVSADKSDVFDSTAESFETSDIGLDLATEDTEPETETTAVIEKLPSQTEETKPLKKRAVHETSNGAAAPTEQKISLNRSSTINVPVSVKSSEEEEEEKVSGDDAVGKDTTASAAKPITSVKTMTANERLALRAQRFNMSSSDKTLKVSQSSTAVTTVKNTIKGPVGGLVKAPDLDVLKKRAERFGENVSTVLKKLEEKEKVLKRKLRFGASATSGALSSTDEQEKKKVRAQRFGLS